MSSDNGKIASQEDENQSSIACLIDSEIKRYAETWRSNSRAAVLRFAADIERRFEIDTSKTRIRELRFTVALGIGFYLATPITDSVFVPDLGLTAFMIRLPVVLLLLFFILIGPKLSYRSREALLTAIGIVAVVVLATIPAISSAPLSPFAFGTAWLGLVFGNTTVALRFRHACIYSIVCGGVTTLYVFIHPRISFDLSWTLTLQILIAFVLGLVTSYRLERNIRLNYLLSTREALRFSFLEADRERLATLSNTDALTGLVNRGYFDRQSEAILADPANAGKGVVLLFIDVDHFKRYNDYYGHPAGDRCLRAVTEAFSGALCGWDVLTARYGGEEFAALLLDIKQSQVELLAERVCKAVSAQSLQHANRNDGVKIVTISVGVAYGIIGEHLTIKNLITAADNALYAAKRRGRNRIEFRLPEAA